MLMSKHERARPFNKPKIPNVFAGEYNGDGDIHTQTVYGWCKHSNQEGRVFLFRIYLFIFAFFLMCNFGLSLNNLWILMNSTQCGAVWCCSCFVFQTTRQLLYQVQPEFMTLHYGRVRKQQTYPLLFWANQTR